MTMRIATFAASDRMLAASLQTQARAAALQLQQASGQVSTSYGGLGTSARKALNLDVSLARSKSYGDAASEAASRVQMMYDAVSSMTDLLTSARAAITAARSVNNSTAAGSNLSQTASQYLDEFAALLNTQFEGRYLFAGAATTTKPVDLSALGPADIASSDTAYYQGDSTILSVAISTDQTLPYGVTANNDAFEKAIRALGALASATGTPDETLLSGASDLVTSALDASAAVQSKLSVTAGRLQDVVARNQDYQDFVTTELSKTKDADVTAIAVQLTSYQTQLQASYSALAKIQSLSILSYLT